MWSKLWLPLMLPSLIWAQDGAAIYKERCGLCHDEPVGRIPALAAIKAMSPEAIYSTLTSGVMKGQAAGLSSSQIITLITYIAPSGGRQATASVTPTCTDGDAARFEANLARRNSARWNGWSPDVTNSRFQNAASAELSSAMVPRLKLKWAFNLGNVTVARSQPTIVAGRLFIGTQAGAVFALDTETGCSRWMFHAQTAVRSGTAFGEASGSPAIFFSDARANVYALNAETGKLIWKVRPVDQAAALATATPQFYKGVLYQPFSSFEEALGADPNTNAAPFAEV
jgi:polyvinyl alcohol dehydrogenase (cytochrome)